MRWAGDLDGDQKLDFVLEDQSEGDFLELHLSSAALPGKKVRLVAQTDWGGC